MECIKHICACQRCQSKDRMCTGPLELFRNVIPLGEEHESGAWTCLHVCWSFVDEWFHGESMKRRKQSTSRTAEHQSSPLASIYVFNLYPNSQLSQPLLHLPLLKHWYPPLLLGPARLSPAVPRESAWMLHADRKRKATGAEWSASFCPPCPQALAAHAQMWHWITDAVQDHLCNTHAELTAAAECTSSEHAPRQSTRRSKH